MRSLIVNADDFGQSGGINDGVIAAHRRGIVTSASLMVRWAAAEAAAEAARSNPELGVGLHVDLGEWSYRAGAWTVRYAVLTPSAGPEDIAAEIDGQLRAFVDLMGREPTHLDAHQHVHREEPTRTIMADAARHLGVNLRGVGHRIRHCGAFYGQSGNGHPVPEAITVEGLLAILRDLPAGVTELGCHPGLVPEVESMYSTERRRELDTLCDPRVREAVEAEGIRLVSFRDVGTEVGQDRGLASGRHPWSDPSDRRLPAPAPDCGG